MRSRNLAGLLLVGAAALAACGGTSGYSTSASAPAAPKRATPTTAVSVSHTQLGNVLVNASGRTLYGFTNDVNGVSTCAGACAHSWIPVAVATSWRPAARVTSARLHTVPRGDGELQLAAGKWPLYTFTGDTAPGDVNGLGSLGKWFVVQPDGSLHKNDTTSTTAPSMYGY